MSFFAELKRRNVVRTGLAYALIAWVVLQVVDFLTQLIGAPAWVLQIFFIAAAVGLLAVLILSWVYEVTPQGIKREAEVDRTDSITPQTGRKLDRLIIVFLAVAVAFLLGQRYWYPAQDGDSRTVNSKTTEIYEDTSGIKLNEKSVAVLPFKALSNGPDDGFFADGLTEEILNALAQLPELLVTARTSAFSFKGKDLPVGEIAATLGVEHIVEGSVRHSGERIRVTAQLIRAEDGFQLWSQTYDSTSADAITVQEDIAEQIATSLDVVLDDARREAMRKAGLRDATAFTAFQKGKELSRIAHGSADQIPGLLEANEYFSTALERVPGYPPALMEHADAYVHIINDDATFEPTVDDLEQSLIDSAHEIAISDFTIALDNARSLQERNDIELDLAVVTGDFYRIRKRVELVLESNHCERNNWIDPMASIFGYADELQKRLEIQIACDPLGPVMRFSQARAALWAGKPEEAIKLVDDAKQLVEHPWLDAVKLSALVAAGQFETAEAEIKNSRSNVFFDGFKTMRLSAARGDIKMAEEAYENLTDRAGELGYFVELQFYAWIGNRATANRMAAEIDARAYGPLPLILITLWCSCGAPFDLEATPNFAASLEQGDLPWPPASPIKFPHKDW